METLKTLAEANKKTEGGKFISGEQTKGLEELIGALNDELEHLSDRKQYHKKYYRQHKRR